MGWYSRFVTRRPWVVIGFDILLVLIMAPISIWYAGLPDFSDPNKGFEPRGTSIHGWNEATTRLTTRLLKENGSLTYLPSAPEPATTHASDPPVDATVHGRLNAQQCLAERLEGVAQRILPAAVIKAAIEDPPTAIPRLVTETEDGGTLWTAAHMRSICEIEKKYITSWRDDGCPAFSLPYYIGALRDKKCNEIHDNDMDAMLDLLRNCSIYYIDGSLTDSCYHDNQNTTACESVPQQCKLYNAPYYIFHYFADVDFLKNGDASKKFLKYSTIIYRKSWDYDEDSLLEHFLRDLEQYRFDVRSGGVVVKAMDYYLIFNPLSRYYVLSDLPFYVFAMILVVIVLLVYLRSPPLLLAVMLNVGLSLFAAYFLYHVVFQFKYFTFVNLLAFLLLIAVGADDVFILHDIWEQLKFESEYELSIEEINSHTLRHGVLSILVTSLTTAAALFSNGVNNVTALKCFGIFGGLCILVNFFFMITMVPAILVLTERYSRKHPDRCKTKCTTKMIAKMSDISQALWGRIMPKLLLKPWLLWLVLFTVVGIGGLVVVFYKPAFRLPTSERIQVFYSSHPFEVYRNQMLDKFHFEIENDIASKVNIELQFPFGIKGEDNGNILDPDDKGTLEYDKAFEIFSPNSQAWMKKFCSKLLEDKYTVSPERYRCFFDVVHDLVESTTCYYSVFNLTIPSQCCNNEFPLRKADAKVCYKDYAFVSLVAMTVGGSNQSLVGTPIYKRGNGKLVAMTHLIETDFTWTPKYPEIDTYYTHFESFMLDVLESAPNGVKGGWFAGAAGFEFFFYDLQKTMVEGTISGIALSMGVGFIVMLFTSGNILITIYSIVTIAFVIGTTVGALVLLGWQLEVLEALVITLAVGLSIDFTIHLAVAYKLSPHSNRVARSRDAIATVGSAVTMAGLTTFLSGAAITLGRVMSYYKFGVFLMLDMTISWAFALFFFIPLCRFIGPEGKFAELKTLADKCIACCGCSCKTDTSEFDDAEKMEQTQEEPEKSDARLNGDIPNSPTKDQKNRVEHFDEKDQVKYTVDQTQDFGANKMFTIKDYGKEKAMYLEGEVMYHAGREMTNRAAAAFNTYDVTHGAIVQTYKVYHDKDQFNWTTNPENMYTERQYLSAPTSPVTYIMTNPYPSPQTTLPTPRSKKARKAARKRQSRKAEHGGIHAQVQRSQTLPVLTSEMYYTWPHQGWSMEKAYRV